MQNPVQKPGSSPGKCSGFERRGAIHQVLCRSHEGTKGQDGNKGDRSTKVGKSRGIAASIPMDLEQSEKKII